MQNINREKEWLVAVLKQMNNSEAELGLFAAYINNGLCYEYFCEGVPPKVFYTLCVGMDAVSYFREAVKECGIVTKGVQRFVGVAFDDFDMWYHFLGGIETILNNEELAECLPVQDRNLACSLLALWNAGKLNEDTWNSYLGNAGIIA